MFVTRKKWPVKQNTSRKKERKKTYVDLREDYSSSSISISTQWVDMTQGEDPYSRTLQTVLCHDDKSTQTVATCGDKALQFDGTEQSFGSIIEWQRLKTIHKVFRDLTRLMIPYVNTCFRTDISDQILMTLMKLKLNLLLADIARRFRISEFSESNSDILDWCSCTAFVWFDHLAS